MSSNDADETRPTKRPRASTSSDIADPAQNQKSERYWFEDGNVVLLVGDLLFRVHRGILSHHSPVFRDTFSIPQPATSGEAVVIDGCPVAVLSGDEPEDWECLFRVMYDHDTTYKSEGILQSKTLLSMLHLGRKYQFDVFFNAAIDRLAICFPSTVDQWSILTHELSHNDPVLIAVLCLMVEMGKQTLLPMLYLYCAVVFDLDQIFQKCLLEARDSAFSSKVVQTILVGREEICEFSREQQVTWVSMLSTREYCKNCSNKVVCYRAVLQMNKLKPLEYMYLTLEDAEALLDTTLENIDSELCSGCRTGIAAAHEKNREIVWEKPSTYFGLPPWNELKDS